MHATRAMQHSVEYQGSGMEQVGAAHLEVQEQAEQQAEYVETRQDLPKQVVHSGRAEHLELPSKDKESQRGEIRQDTICLGMHKQAQMSDMLSPFLTWHLQCSQRA